MKLREIFNRQLNEATLRRGSRGDDVKALQRSLGIRPADGIFGPQTERAVRNFQTAANVTVDGIAGGQTQAAIRRFQEEPGASSDYGNIRPGTDWSDLDPGEIEVTPAANPGPEVSTTAPVQPAAPQDIENPDTSSAAQDAEVDTTPPQGLVAPERDAAPVRPNDAAQRAEEAAKIRVEEFVTAQVAELTRIRRNMPEDQLIRTITKNAVEQGLNDDFIERSGMAEYIAELVPTIDRTAAPDPDAAAQVDPDANDPRGRDQRNTPQQPDAAPSVDSTAAAAQQLSRFQTVYGVGTGGDGLPSLFSTKFLDPALSPLDSTTMQALSDELVGEIPPAPARVIVQRLEQAYDNEQELKQAADEMRGDTDPEIQDQVRALDILIPLLTKLKQDAARNESVELDRLMMLAGV